ncbi:MAG: hypothetical protein GY832_24125 [Chloroflexi bacterium]|nr:hypothetical protein [Chloroflexota bacterium]
MSTSSNRSATRTAANVATVLFVVTIILQFLLAAGILPITMAWGGRQPVLTTSLRIASLVSAAILGFFIYVIRRRAGLVGDAPIPTIIKILSWFTTAFQVLNTLTNLTSLSIGEKVLFGPITFFLAVSCLVVSISKSES